MINFGMVIFNPTSSPTIKIIPKNNIRITLSFNRPKHALKELVSITDCSLGMFVRISHRLDKTMIPPKIGNISFQFPKDTDATPAIIGPKNEDIALTNCPRVSELVNFSPLTTLATKGLRDTCNMVLPIPKRAKASNTVENLYEITGINIATRVTSILNKTVFFLPSLFINKPVGTEKTANHKNTITGIIFTRVSDRLKSCLT